MRIALKNTFLTFVDHDENCQDAAANDTASVTSPCQAASPRSRSADVRSCSPKPSSERDAPGHEQIERLNKIFSPVQSPSASPRVHPIYDLSGAAASASGDETFEAQVEIMAQRRQGRQRSTSAGSSAATAKASSDLVHVTSNGSVSTMVPDQEAEEDYEERIKGGYGIEFDLTIEENPQAAHAATSSSSKSCAAAPGVTAPKLLASGGSSHEPDAKASPKSPLPKEYRHSHVPKNIDLTKEYQAYATSAAAPTTLMIRNIPNHYTQRQLIAELDGLGFSGEFDFLYIPLDKGTMSNVGYAFVNFCSPESAEKCMATFVNYRFKRHRKIAAVSVAHIQGLEANLAHYENAAVNTAKLKQRRPMVLTNTASLSSSAAACDETETCNTQVFPEAQ